MNYTDALAYLDSLTDYEKRTGYVYSAETFDLRRPRELLALLGNPQDRFPSVLVAGTKGKGSTSVMIASILRASGRRVGLYSQPHLHSFRERIRVDSKLITSEQFALAVESVIPAVERFRRERPELGMPTSYEVVTAAAFLFFVSQRPDLVVLEVGLGGRLDATNVATPLVSVITPISLDHVHLLGDTIAKIAAEKAGIIKEGGVVVAARQTEEAMGVIRGVATERGARVVVAAAVAEGEAKKNASSPGGTLAEGEPAHPIRESTAVDLRGESGRLYHLEIPLLGAHQVANAATAITVVEQLGKLGFPVDADAVERGMREVRWPGRLEIVSRSPLTVVDGAHNGDSAQKLAAALRECFAYRRLILLLGTSSDKDVEGIASALAPEAWTVIATRSRHPRAADPERLAAEARRWCPRVEISPDLAAAIARATALAGPSDLICITGSLFTVADARDCFGLAPEKD
jgi:dihydrofolate synthase / folylpolyglutamate synthase